MDEEGYLSAVKGNEGKLKEDLVTSLLEVVGQLLGNVGALTRLDVLVVLGDDEALASLAADNTGGAEATVDGGVVSLQGAVLGASDGETIGLKRTGVGETGNDLGGLVLGDVEASGGGPHGAIMSVEGTLGDTPSSNEGVIDVRLPRHVVLCVAL